MHHVRKRFAPVQPLEVSAPAVETVKRLYLLRRYFNWRLLPVDLLQDCLGVVQGVNGLDHLARIVLEQKNKELGLIVLQHLH